MKFRVPPNIPSNPEEVYKGKGWKGEGDFLGSGGGPPKMTDEQREENRLWWWALGQKVIYHSGALKSSREKKLRSSGFDFELSPEEFGVVMGGMIKRAGEDGIDLKDVLEID